ncbi:MAG: hypothetical protein NTX24_03600 [Candidatus Pacearchaeota archaeon]|nr:hypothetical protein [Candidatus Pacearchaeota archaeon]
MQKRGKRENSGQKKKKKWPIWAWVVSGFFLAIVLIFVLAIIFGSPDDTNDGNIPELETTYLPSIMSGVYNQYPNLNLQLLEYNLTNKGDKPITVTFVSEIQDYTSQAKDILVLQPHESTVFSQHPLLKPSVQINEITNANLYFKVAVGNTSVDEETIPIKLYSKDTMIWGFEEDEEFIDTSYLIGAWVTPHIEEIDQLIRISAEYHPDRVMTGYQCSDCETDEDWQTYTDLQVGAIYTALKEQYDIIYINTPIAYSSHEEASQRVKLPKETIDLASANCIEGAVLFSSALESAGINPYIVLLPGHAFVCWDISPDGKIIDCLEATMIQNYDFFDAEKEGLKEYKAETDSGNFEDGTSQLISIKELRDEDIVPMS